ncbi:MAG TPA: MoaD/ThiS family protein [Fimbriimonadaceae bacterium]|nr:MoaD/ThiS family protein [Fimbriimonadaceae bacterium]
MMQVRVQYYAVFREQRGLGEETIETSVATAGDLYRELAARHGFALPPSLVRASVNLQFRSLDAALSPGDTVVFIPPVAGG